MAPEAGKRAGHGLSAEEREDWSAEPLLAVVVEDARASIVAPGNASVCMVVCAVQSGFTVICPLTANPSSEWSRENCRPAMVPSAATSTTNSGNTPANVGGCPGEASIPSQRITYLPRTVLRLHIGVDSPAREIRTIVNCHANGAPDMSRCESRDRYRG